MGFGDLKTSAKARQFGHQLSALLTIAMMGVVCWLSACVPPFQSPDEIDHLKRAYLLTQGVFLLDKGDVVVSGQRYTGSGGMIDQGLLAFMDYHFQFAARPEFKREADSEVLARSIPWQRSEAFSLAPGTAYYFPLIYAPQALGLFLGQAFDWSIADSYQLARYFAVACIAILLLVANHLQTLPLMTLAFLGLPMTLFQMSATSIDGLACALACVCVSGYLKMMNPLNKSSLFGLMSWGLVLAALITCRVHMLPMLILWVCLATQVKKIRFFVVGIVVTALVITWIGVASHGAVDPRVHLGRSTSELAIFYLSHPFDFFRVLFTTLSDAKKNEFYWRSFIGILGWLDTPMSASWYEWLSLSLLLVVIAGFVSVNLKGKQATSAVLAFCAGTSSLLVFFALLISWTPAPALQIEGVQGRYFLIPALLISYLSPPPFEGRTPWQNRLSFMALIFFLALSLMSLQQTISTRYTLS